MGATFKNRVYFAVAMARDERDRDAGRRAYRMERGERKGHGRRTWVGPVRAGGTEAENYSAARADAAAAHRAEFGERVG